MSERLKIDRVLFATDFSPACKAALPQTVALAHRFRAQLYLLHIVPTGGTPSELAAAERRAAAEVRHLEAQLPAELDNLVVAVMAGDPAARILQKASDVAADLIVMGTRRGRVPSGRGRCVAGAVALAAPCPVLTIPHGRTRTAAARRSGSPQ
jgi:nucleotide-binding universal stress UspA family protein